MKRRHKKNEADAVASLRALMLHRLLRQFSVEIEREITLASWQNKQIDKGKGVIPQCSTWELWYHACSPLSL
jgi:hypothetical protein